MPPTLFFILETPFTQLAHVLFPKAMANGVITGAFAFCESSIVVPTRLSAIELTFGPVRFDAT